MFVARSSGRALVVARDRGNFFQGMSLRHASASVAGRLELVQR